MIAYAIPIFVLMCYDLEIKTIYHKYSEGSLYLFYINIIVNLKMNIFVIILHIKNRLCYMNYYSRHVIKQVYLIFQVMKSHSRYNNIFEALDT